MCKYAVSLYKCTDCTHYPTTSTAVQLQYLSTLLSYLHWRNHLVLCIILIFTVMLLFVDDACNWCTYDKL